jgi:uncharacterized protein
MSTLTQTAPDTISTDYLNARSEDSKQTFLAATVDLPITHPKRNPLDSTRLTYTPTWFGLGVGAAALSLLATRRYGAPAIAGIGALGAASLAYTTLFEPAKPTLERITLSFPALPAALDGLRIGHITDIHIGQRYTARNLAWAVEKMRCERPDLIALTGDLAGLHHGIPELPILLSQLSAPLGIYAVPGNHDYCEGLADLHAALTISGVALLINEHQQLRWNGADLWLVGIDDIWDGRPDFAAALDGVPQDAFTLLLAHSPDIADEAAQHGFALQLSGHTHGGHVRLPLLGPFARPRFGMRYIMGQYRVGEMALYVSRGLGGVSLRLFCRPEATIFTLRRG